MGVSHTVRVFPRVFCRCCFFSLLAGTIKVQVDLPSFNSLASPGDWTFSLFMRQSFLKSNKTPMDPRSGSAANAMHLERVPFGGKKSIFLGGTWNVLGSIGKHHGQISWPPGHLGRNMCFFAGVSTVGVGLAAGQWWGCFTGRNEDDLDHLHS